MRAVEQCPFEAVINILAPKVHRGVGEASPQEAHPAIGVVLGVLAGIAKRLEDFLAAVLDEPDLPPNGAEDVRLLIG